MGYSAQIQQPQTSGGYDQSPMGGFFSFMRNITTPKQPTTDSQPIQNKIVYTPSDFSSGGFNSQTGNQPSSAQGKGLTSSVPPSPQQNYQTTDIQRPTNTVFDSGTPQGKGASGQRFTYSPTSGQPQMGRPNQYTNTVGQWDNASIMQTPPALQQTSISQPTKQQPAAKGKGG